MESNFLITAFGRSGTKFLSSVLNKSKRWNVLHEPRGSFDEQSYKNGHGLPLEAESSFRNNHYYGEVNSYMRFFLDDMYYLRRGIIFRNPMQIVLSIANRKDSDRTIELIDEVYEFVNRKFYHYIENSPDIIVIDFDTMTTHKPYLMNVAEAFGIHDIDWSKVSMNKVNKTIKPKYKSFSELPDEIKNAYLKKNWNG